MRFALWCVWAGLRIFFALFLAVAGQFQASTAVLITLWAESEVKVRAAEHGL